MREGDEEFLFFTPSDPGSVEIQATANTTFILTTGGASARYRHVVQFRGSGDAPVPLRTEE